MSVLEGDAGCGRDPWACTVDAGLICGDGVLSITVRGCRGWPFMNAGTGTVPASLPIVHMWHIVS